MLAQLDDKASVLAQVQMKEAKLQEDNDNLRKALTEATMSQKQLQAQLSTLQDGFQSSLQALTTGRHVMHVN